MQAVLSPGVGSMANHYALHEVNLQLNKAGVTCNICPVQDVDQVCFSSACIHTALLSWCGRPTRASEIVGPIQAKFQGQLTISPKFHKKILCFVICFVFVYMGSYTNKHFKRLLLSSGPISTKLYVKNVSRGVIYRLLHFWRCAKLINFMALWDFC